MAPRRRSLLWRVKSSPILACIIALSVLLTLSFIKHSMNVGKQQKYNEDDGDTYSVMAGGIPEESPTTRTATMTTTTTTEKPTATKAMKAAADGDLPVLQKEELSESVLEELKTFPNPLQLKTGNESRGKRGIYHVQTMKEPFEYPFSFDFTQFMRLERKPPPNRGQPGSDAYYASPELYNTVKRLNTTAYRSRTCSAITGRRVLMNYGHNCCKYSQPLNCKTGLEKGGFDMCYQFNKSSIDDFFLAQNSEVIDKTRMAGYGLWKPYLIFKLLLSLDDDDVLFYSDSGAEIIAPLEDYFCLMDELNQDVVVFSVGLPEDQFTKGDAFLMANCATKECVYSQQRMGTFSMFRKSMFSVSFMSLWLTINADARVASDDVTKLNANAPSFKTNRHDQTSLSLASKRFGIRAWPEPSQWAEKGMGKELRDMPMFKSIAKTVIRHTRNKS